MKKALSILLALSLIFGLFAGIAGNVSAADYIGDKYAAQDNGDGTCTIVYNADPNATSISVPKYVNGMRVTALGFACFEGFDQLKSVTIPEGVRSIGEYAFSNCWNLTSVSLPSSLVSIDSAAFLYCAYDTNLKITIPKNVSYIGAAAVAGASSISVDKNNPYFTAANGVLYSKDMTKLVQYPVRSTASSFKIPSSVIEIGDGAFSSAYFLQSVSIPSSVCKIGYAAFDTSGLTSVTLPDRLTAISDGAFAECYSLKSVTFPKELNWIGACAFLNCESLKEVVLPYGTARIINEAFEGCTSLSRVVIPSTVGCITLDAFTDCKALSSLEFTGTQAQWNLIGAHTEWGSASPVKSSIIKFTGTDLEDSLFRYAQDGSNGKVCVYALKDAAKSSTALEIPQSVNGKNVEFIGSYVFAYCNQLEQVVLPEGITSMGDYVFKNCNDLKTVSLPTTLRYPGGYTFYNCSDLKSVRVPEGITEITNCMFVACYNLREVTLPDSMIFIDDDSFVDCNMLTSLELPKNIRWIGADAFMGCGSLQSITLPDSVREIGAFAFNGCFALRRMYIPRSLAYIGEDAFYNCINMKRICYAGTSAQWANIWNTAEISKFSSPSVYFNCTTCDPVVGDFLDVKASDWFKDSVAYVYENELMNGTSDMFFTPSGSLTRGQLVTILYRVAGEPDVETVADFSDVPSGKYFSNAVAWAAENSIVNGYNDGTFKPDNKITREQIATILYRYKNPPEVAGTLDFPDAEKISTYARDAMTWAVSEGLITGIKSNGVTTLAPKNTATRAQIATIIMRYLEAE